MHLLCLCHFRETSHLERATGLRRGIHLEYLTIGWNVLECAVAVIAGVLAGSVALIGFGVDSAIESVSGAVLLWRLQVERLAPEDRTRAEHVERRALRLVGISFFLLAVYIGVDALHTLLTREPPKTSLPGLVLAVLSLIVMPLLARAKRHTAAHLNSAALHADSRQTSLCAYLSAILLGGLLLNATLGWWWADPVAALAMAPIIVGEGRQAYRSEACVDCH
jgi:divalent metal cation (Fe/Co/Zn/Cd) transporter